MSSLARRPLLLAITVISIIAIWRLAVPAQALRPWSSSISSITGHSTAFKLPSTARLHVLISAQESDINLCKTILSALVLGYGVPTLSMRSGMDAETAWIEGSLKYLRALDKPSDDDLVLIVDPSNVWFQLPPSILIDRYHEINVKAEERERLAEGSSRAVKSVPELRIIFGAHKRCWSEDERDADCTAVPESPLPVNIFGPDTGKILDVDQPDRYQFVQPRWLSSGMTIGPVRQLRFFLERVQEIIRAGEGGFVSYQAALNHVFAEQGRSRQARAGSKSSSVADQSNYTLGLDYESALSFSSLYAPYATSFITFSDSRSISRARKTNSIANPHSIDLGADLAKVAPPFSILSSTNIEPISSWRWYKSPHTPWTDVPLFTNLYTGITPALIHHDDPDDVTFKKEKWREMWFQPMARDLLDSRLGAAENTIHVDKEGRQWWNAVGRTKIEKEGFGVPIDDGQSSEYVWRQWNDLCREEDQAEIFGDGKGAFVQDRTIGG